MSQPRFEKDLENKRVTVTHSFKAPLSRVWQAWTDSALTDRWWGPKPWRAVTVEQNFVPGGHWLYYMAGPEGERHYCRVDFKQIEHEKSFSCVDSFCDEKGITSNDIPASHWHVTFEAQGDVTKVVVTISYDSVEDMRKYVELGFEQGFTIGLGQLEELLAQ